MDDQTFQDKFAELMEKIRQLPEDQRERLERLADETQERRQRIKNSVGKLSDSLDHLRLSVKYLVFDLEATRRENAYLRRLVEQMSKDKGQNKDQTNDNFLDGEDF